MTSNVTVSNRQRRHELDRDWFSETCNKLFSTVVANLKKNPAEHLEDLDLDELEKRGIVSIVLVSDKTIARLNKQWMNKDRPTDVLSFPLEMEAPPEPLPWEVGEIVVSVDRALAQAKEYGHSFERELAFLVVHGLLHVLGFDHMTAEDEKEMFGRQKKILTSAGFRR